MLSASCLCMIFCLSTTGKYKECPLLPDLQGGHSSCRSIEGGSVCYLECDVDKKFPSSLDYSPQRCFDGEWSYQMMKLPFPTCEGVSVTTLRMNSNLTGYSYDNIIIHFFEKNIMALYILCIRCVFETIQCLANFHTCTIIYQTSRS